ncbi:MAG: hypothetical protein AAFV53_37595 [Myxococcota bacterium]
MQVLNAASQPLSQIERDLLAYLASRPDRRAADGDWEAARNALDAVIVICQDTHGLSSPDVLALTKHGDWWLFLSL